MAILRIHVSFQGCVPTIHFQVRAVSFGEGKVINLWKNHTLAELNDATIIAAERVW